VDSTICGSVVGKKPSTIYVLPRTQTVILTPLSGGRIHVANSKAI